MAKKVSLLLSFVGICLIAILLYISQPALAVEDDFRSQVEPLINNIANLRDEGLAMESLRVSEKLHTCAVRMRTLLPEAEIIDEKVRALEIDDDLASSITRDTVSAAATTVSLCVSCLRSALDHCHSVSNSLKLAQDILNNK